MKTLGTFRVKAEVSGGKFDGEVARVTLVLLPEDAEVGELRLDGIVIRSGANGRFVRYPSRSYKKDGETKWWEHLRGPGIKGLSAWILDLMEDEKKPQAQEAPPPDGDEPLFE